MPRMLLALLLLLTALSAAAAPTPHNDDSCDIAVLPAATLLLPYFEVDLDNFEGETTLFTITNVTNVDQIAHVTLWTDYAFPVLNFNIYLTGYDVQSINLFDVIARGIIAPTAGTGTAVPAVGRRDVRGTYSDLNRSLDLERCDRLAGTLDEAYVKRMHDAFTIGSVDNLGTIDGCSEVGHVHDNAVGYATVDVVGSCATSMATDRDYWTKVIRYDNALVGDYQQVNSSRNSARGGPMVHIRAVPEGGTPESRARLHKYDAGFGRTFYSAFLPPDLPGQDGRQPLPAQFAARWIHKPFDLHTSLKIWREGRGLTACRDLAANGQLELREIAVFDENENVTAQLDPRLGDPPIRHTRVLPATSQTAINDSSMYPQLANGATSGWVYLNLDRDGAGTSQNWVITAMNAIGQLSTEIDSVAMGNGCSAPIRQSEVSNIGGAEIGPSPNRSPRSGRAATDNDDSCDVALLPAATLLLPYFEVDLDTVGGETTLFTITNVGAKEQIARVTLWTDFAFPVITFNVYLTGYDVASINLFDVIARGVVAPGGTGRSVSPRGLYSDRNPAVGRGCDSIADRLADEWIDRMQDAFTLGSVSDFGAEEGCDEVGHVHDNAVGYATIDLVRNCSGNDPLSAEYWTDDLAYDNVLAGDYQQVNVQQGFAQGSPLVHIRAVPEGGTAAERARDKEKYETAFPRTFYSALQSPRTPKLDGRQPLPATFAARWIQGSANQFRTSFKIWREAKSGRPQCGRHDDNMAKVAEMVRFDEAENAVGAIPVSRVCAPIHCDVTLPATSFVSVADSWIFPQLTNGAIGGWMYMNLDHGGVDAQGSQNWAVISMRAQGRYSADMDAAALGNGCSPATPASEVTRTGGVTIGPAPNEVRR